MLQILCRLLIYDMLCTLACFYYFTLDISGLSLLHLLHHALRTAREANGGDEHNHAHARSAVRPPSRPAALRSLFSLCGMRTSAPLCM